MKTKLFRILGILVTLSLLLAACAAPEPTKAPTKPAAAQPAVVLPTTAPAKAPKAGGTLIAARAADAKGMDPHKQTAFSSFRVVEQIYEPLLAFDAKMNVVPNLAESWKWSEDGKILTMKIRANVKFHNGTPMTSEDVKFSFERVLDEKTAAAARASFTDIDKIDTPDATTVIFNLKNPNVALIAAMANPNIAILSKALIGGGKDPATEVVGTGPFKLVKWEPDKTLTLEKNKDYWLQGKPMLDKIEFRTIPDEASILAGLRAKEIDYALINDPRVARTAVTTQGLEISRAPALAYHVLQLNPAKDVFKDVRVRQAISCAIDRKQVLDTASLGEGMVTPPATPEFYRAPLDQLTCYKKDIAKSKELLAQAGVKDVKFTIIAANDEPPTAIAEAQNIQAQLKEIGVEVKIESLELAVYVDRWLKGDFEACTALNGGNPDPHNMFNRYWISTGNLQKVSNYTTPELDKLMAQGQSTTDPEKRKAIYLDVQKKLAEAAPWVWLYVGYEYRVMQPYVKDYTALSNGAQIYLRDVWLDK